MNPSKLRAAQEAWDYLQYGLPRRKFAPEHPYTTVYFTGMRLAALIDRKTRMARLFVKGIRDYREEYSDEHING